jgi:tetratricopeptide (TPR) repeat protein
MTDASALPTSSCLDDETIAAAVEHGLGRRVEGIEAHLADCSFCRGRLTALARDDDSEVGYASLVGDDTGPGAAPPSGRCDTGMLSPGATIGRYIILFRIGSGGMGVVYTAYDPELDRRIAIKVIRHDLGGKDGEGDDRLRREARAMARLTHPNVVRVYDVGTQGSLVYIAMEHVAGADLGRVMADRKPSWRQAVALCLQAGDGLVAAHAAGLVHRDIKPSNVLCADDGRVLVADFGLTSLASGRRSGASDGERGAGTPGFAAPEQIAGAPPDMRSDQYSFAATVTSCVGDRAPRAVSRVLARGLAREPDQRFESLSALLGALRRAAFRRRRIAIASTVAAGALAVGALAVASWPEGQDASEACATDDARFAILWGPSRRAGLIAALRPEDRARADFFLAALDARAGSLRVAQQAACYTGVVVKAAPPGGYIRQLACLRVEAAKLDAVVSFVERGGSLDAAHGALDGVQGGDSCELGPALLATIAPPSDEPTIQRIAEIDRMIGEQLAMSRGELKLQGLARAREAVAASEQLGDPMLVARANLAEARALASLERYDEERAVVERARDAAIAGHDDVRLVLALIYFVELAIERDRLPEAEAHLETASALAHSRALSSAIRVHLHVERSQLALARGGAAAALAELANAEPELAAIEDPDVRADAAIRIAQLRSKAYGDAGDLTHALTAAEQASRLVERVYGPTYAGVAKQELNVVVVLQQLGRTADARALLDRARKLLVGPTAAKEQLARSWQLEGVLLYDSGQIEASLPPLQRALQLYREVNGDDHRTVFKVRNSIARTLDNLGRKDEAIDMYEQCLRWSAAHEGEHSRQAQVARLNIASAIVLDALAAHYARAGELLGELDATLPSDDAIRVQLLATRGAFAALHGNYADAIESYQSARTLAARLHSTPPALLAFIAFRTADALWGAGRHSEAIAAAHQARAMFKAVPGREKSVANVTAWLAAHENSSRPSK